MQFYGKIVLLVIATVLVYGVQSRSAGPPANEATFRDQVCNNMMPNHAGVAAQGGNGGYTISTDLPRISDTEYAYMADQTYAGKLTACGVDL